MNESSFNLNVPECDRNIGNTYKSVDISTVNVYESMDHCYFGNGPIRSGSYLIPFSRESDYLSRRQLSHYKNYVKPIIRAMVEPVFNAIAPRVITDDNGQNVESLFKSFIENCDVSGTHLQDSSHTAINICRRHGVVFVVVDNFDSEEQPATMADAERLRVMPYVYTKTAQECADYKTDRFGNLEYIIFQDEPVYENGKKLERWRKWTVDETITLSKTDSGWVEIGRTYHGIGQVPVVVLFSDQREDKSVILVDPPLYDLARLNLVIYNQSAEIRDQERAQAFSIFYVQGLPDGDMVVGPKNVLNLAMDVTIAPGYASPDFGIIKGLVENQEQIRKDLFLIAEQAGVVGVQNAESGISKAYDFFAHEDTLKRTSYLATTLEVNISKIFQLYTGEYFVYTVDYPMDFAPMGLDREIARIDTVFKMPDLNRLLKYRLQEKLAKLLFADDSRESLDEIIESIREESVKIEEPVETPEVPEPLDDNIDNEISAEDKGEPIVINR